MKKINIVIFCCWGLYLYAKMFSEDPGVGMLLILISEINDEHSTEGRYSKILRALVVLTPICWLCSFRASGVSLTNHAFFLKKRAANYII